MTDYAREIHVSPQVHESRCECGHIRSEHDEAFDFVARCGHVDIDPNAPEWAAKTRCRCKSFRPKEAK